MAYLISQTERSRGPQGHKNNAHVYNLLIMARIVYLHERKKK